MTYKPLPDKDWLTAKDIADHMELEVGSVKRNLLAKGYIEAVKIGHEWRIAREAYLLWKQPQRVNLSGIEKNGQSTITTPRARDLPDVPPRQPTVN